MSEPTALEREVIQMLLAGDIFELSVLREQSEGMVVSNRKLTGVGFFTTLTVPDRYGRLPNNQAFRLGDVTGIAANVKYGLGFLLCVTDGTLATLEGYTYDEPWPIQIEGLTLSYNGAKRRDLEKILQTIHSSPISFH